MQHFSDRLCQVKISHVIIWPHPPVWTSDQNYDAFRILVVYTKSWSNRLKTRLIRPGNVYLTVYWSVGRGCSHCKLTGEARGLTFCCFSPSVLKFKGCFIHYDYFYVVLYENSYQPIWHQQSFNVQSHLNILSYWSSCVLAHFLQSSMAIFFISHHFALWFCVKILVVS